MKNTLKQLSTIIIVTAFGFLYTNMLYAKENMAKQSINKEERKLSPFKNIIISGSGKLYIKQGKKDSVRIEVPEDILPKIRSEVKGNNLYLGPKEDLKSLNTSINYYLTLQQLESIEASGSIEVICKENISAEQFNLAMSGSSKAELKLKIKSLKAQMSGSSFVKIQGSTDEQTIEISGVGEFSGKKFSSNITNVEISGAGVVEASVNNDLDIKISGAGKVKYYGRPKISQEISGSGEIIPLG